MKMITRLVACLLIGLFYFVGNCGLKAAIVVEDNFDSYTGAINGGTGGSGAWTMGWSSMFGSTTAISSSVLSYSAGDIDINGGTRSLQITDNNGNPTLYRKFTPQTGPVYFSFLAQLPLSGLGDQFLGIHFTDSGNGGLDNTPSGEVGLFGGSEISPDAIVRAAVYRDTGSRTDASVPYAVGETVFVVGKFSDEGIENTTPGIYDLMELWVNPTTFTEPAVPSVSAERDTDAGTAVGLTSIDTFAVRTANFSTGQGEIALIDQLVIGTSYASVVGASPLIPGDFDGNSFVNGADLLIWQNNYGLGAGASIAEGDADGDGDVDGRDFLVWQRNHTGGGALSSITSVPEPTSFTMLLSAVTSLFCLRRRTR